MANDYDIKEEFYGSKVIIYKFSKEGVELSDEAMGDYADTVQNKLESLGHTPDDLIEQYYENGVLCMVFLGEDELISTGVYRGFLMNKGMSVGLRIEKNHVSLDLEIESVVCYRRKIKYHLIYVTDEKVVEISLE